LKKREVRDLQKEQTMKRLTGLCALAILTLALGSAAPASAPASPTIFCASPPLPIDPPPPLDPAWGNACI
jgi:hypothetical protein